MNAKQNRKFITEEHIPSCKNKVDIRVSKIEISAFFCGERSAYFNHELYGQLNLQPS